MFRRTARFSRRVILGTLAVSLTAAAAVAGTVHTFAVSQTTGSLGAADFLQTTVPGGALQGETGPAASTAFGTPFGVFGKYGPPSRTTTVGLGVVGISTLGWGVTGESLSGYPALFAFPNSKDGVGLDAESDNGEAIFGESHGSTNPNFGALIYADGNGTGVVTRSEYGVGLSAYGGGGDGIDGYSADAMNGVYGQSTGGYGVQGFSSSSDGVHAEISNGNSGVAGLNDGNGNGVYGRSINGYGVNARSDATPSPAPTGCFCDYAAAYGQSASGPGIYGVNTHNSGMDVGYGSAYVRYTGVSGYGSDGAGVYGYSKNDIGMIAENGSGPATLVVENDVAGRGFEIVAGSGGIGDGGEFNFAVDPSGNAYLSGTVTANDGSLAVSRNPRSDTVTYGAESAEPMVEDVGSAHLVNGAAAVAIDGAFRQTIQDPSNYLVFLTPYGDASLYVASRTPAGFVVRETHGGRSTLDFAYKIVAQRYGVQTGRLPHLAAISPAMARFRFAALHPNASPANANIPLSYKMVAPPVKEGSKRAALLAQARLASDAKRERMSRPPTPPPGFLGGLNR